MVEKNGKARRGFALPITLLLLVMSLTCNIMLLTKNVQNTRDEAVERGRDIYRSFAQSGLSVDEMNAYLEEINAFAGEQNDDAARLTALHAARAAEQGEIDLHQLMTAASEQEPARFEQAPETMDDYWRNKVTAILLSIGEGKGELTETEQTEIVAVQEELTAMSAVLATFDYDIGDDRNSLIQLSNGLNWLDVAAKLQNSLNQAAEK